ncbi:MAG TPA: DUF2442 domain-containing protein [Chlamydiales bacterium]|jgi:hypothetical protein
MDERVEAVYFTRDSLVVDLLDGRTISVPLDWYPKLLKASQKERSHWEICGGGFGIHWPDIDEDLSTAGLLRGLQDASSKHQQIERKSRVTTKRRSSRLKGRPTNQLRK